MLSNNQAAVLLMSLNALPLGFVAYSTVNPRSAGQASSSDNSASHPILKLEGVLCQLSPTEGETRSRYLAIDLDLELEDDSIRGAILQRLPRLRESILAYFSDRTAPQLEQAGALLALKGDLRERLNGLLPDRRIRGVFVTQFIIQ